MVLKNSKWDKKSKLLHLKKHGKITVKINESLPKWTSKKKNAKKNEVNEIKLKDFEWDTDSEEIFVQTFYPELCEVKLKYENIKKLKDQILEEINKESNEVEENSINLSEQKKNINEKVDQFLKKFNISERKKNKKILQNKLSNDFLADYNIPDYQSLVGKNDIDFDFQKKNKTSSLFDEIYEKLSTSSDNLSKDKKNVKKTMSKEEVLENDEMVKKIENLKFKQKFIKTFDLKETLNKNNDMKNTKKSLDNISQSKLDISSKTPTDPHDKSDSDFYDDLNFLLKKLNLSQSDNLNSSNISPNLQLNFNNFLTGKKIHKNFVIKKEDDDFLNNLVN